MKEQYIGDVNDHRKYALLRALTVPTNLRLGICWMLTPPDGRRDGNKVGYLDAPLMWRHYDPEAFDLLGQLTSQPDKRRLASLERSELFPSARFFSALLPDELDGRERYFRQAQEVLAACDLVFFDPDNGLDVPSVPKGKRHSSKYVFIDEVASFWTRGSSVLFYQHHPRQSHDNFAAQMADRLRQELPGSHPIVFRTAHVAFFLLSQAVHLPAFHAAASAMKTRWPASFIRVDEPTIDSPVLLAPLVADRNALEGCRHDVSIELTSGAPDSMAKPRIEDICEVRQAPGATWEIIGIDEALELRKTAEMRCTQCHGAVRPHKGAHNGAFRPHFEHLVHHAGCPRCSRSQGPPTPHPSPVR
jgi:hypothetical protein